MSTCIVPHKIGAAIESLVAAYFLARGFEVYTPLMSQSRCDLIYVDGQRLVRVQVKTGTWSQTGKYMYENCSLSRGLRHEYEWKALTYTSEEIDEVWIAGTHLWCFPVAFVAGRTSLLLNSNNKKPIKTRRDYNPDDFIVIRGSLENPFRSRVTFDDSTFFPLKPEKETK